MKLKFNTNGKILEIASAMEVPDTEKKGKTITIIIKDLSKTLDEIISLFSLDNLKFNISNENGYSEDFVYSKVLNIYKRIDDYEVNYNISLANYKD